VTRDVRLFRLAYYSALALYALVRLAGLAPGQEPPAAAKPAPPGGLAPDRQPPPAAPALPPLVIDPAHRVNNRTDHGVCWWCCAQMIGRQYGIVPLEDIVDKVTRSGRGFKTGARVEDTVFWVKALGLKADNRATAATRDKIPERLAYLTDLVLRRRLPAIVSLKLPSCVHAVLVLHLVPGESVVFIDPNRPAEYETRPWDWFARRVTGRIYAFDPARQEPRYLRLHATPRASPHAPPHAPVQAPAHAPAPVPARTMLSHVKAKVVAEDLLRRVQAQAARPPGPTYGPPAYAHDVPFATAQPEGPPPPPPPSNQDIKDGVVRPADVLYSGPFADPPGVTDATPAPRKETRRGTTR
jgi:hypothetical protein